MKPKRSLLKVFTISYFIANKRLNKYLQSIFIQIKTIPSVNFLNEAAIFSIDKFLNAVNSFAVYETSFWVQFVVPFSLDW